MTTQSSDLGFWAAISWCTQPSAFSQEILTCWHWHLRVLEFLQSALCIFGYISSLDGFLPFLSLDCVWKAHLRRVLHLKDCRNFLLHLILSWNFHLDIVVIDFGYVIWEGQFCGYGISKTTHVPAKAVWKCLVLGRLIHSLRYEHSLFLYPFSI